MKSQHDKIISFCKDGDWHCGNEFRQNFIFSMHKRMIEIEGRRNKTEPITGKYYFIYRKCEHGHKNVKDYKMVLNDKLYREVEYIVPQTGMKILRIETV